MSFIVRWTDITDGFSMVVEREFETAEQAAEFIKEEILDDFDNGISGTYIYAILEEPL